MKPLSEQLSELSAQAKKAEDVVTAAQARNRAVLGKEREQLRSKISEAKTHGEARVAAVQDKNQSWWDDTRSSIDARFAQIHAERDEHRAERDLKKAEKRADEAEEDAAYAIEFAISMLDQANYAIADAVIARADADDLTMG
jgi:chromosome segregation ATPase